MKLWIIYGLIASFCWGTYVILNKIVTSPKYVGMPTSTSAFFMGIGILISFAAYIMLAKSSVKSYAFHEYLLALSPGIVWSLGMIAVLMALNQNVDISKLVLVYNTNTFVTVLLGALVLKEIPQGAELVRVIIGAILVTAGVIIAGWK